MTTPLQQDCCDIMEGLDDDPTLLLLTDRHLRTKTGRDLRAEVAALGRKYFEAKDAFRQRDRALDQVNELRTLCDQLTRRVQELEGVREQKQATPGPDPRQTTIEDQIAKGGV